jgi:hypothetical protein
VNDRMEDDLYRWHLPSPEKVGEKLGISGQHVKNLCRALGQPMLNKGLSPKVPRWKIPRETFRALREHLQGDADSSPEAR